MTELETVDQLIAISAWECIFGTGDERMREAHRALLERRNRIIERERATPIAEPGQRRLHTLGKTEFESSMQPPGLHPHRVFDPAEASV